MKGKEKARLIDLGDGRKILEDREVLDELPEGYTPPILAFEIILQNEHNFSGPTLNEQLRPLLDAITRTIADAGYHQAKCKIGVGIVTAIKGKLSDDGTDLSVN